MSDGTGMNAAEVTGAPGEVTLGGRTLTMGPMTLGDWGRLNQFLRSQYVATARASLAKDANESQRRMTEEVALKASFGITWEAPDAAGYVESWECMTWILWMSISKHHPDITLEWIRKALDDLPTFRRLRHDWARINNLVGGGEKKDSQQTD